MLIFRLFNTNPNEFSRICTCAPQSKSIQLPPTILVRHFCKVLSIKTTFLIVLFQKVGFNPNATMNTAHHMLLYGCGEPGTMKTTW